MFIASVMPSSHPILWCPLLLLPSIFPSIRNFSNESSACIRFPKYWSFSFSISPSGEYSVLISVKNNWFDLLGVQGTFRSLLQHPVRRHTAFLMIKLSQQYVTTRKTTVLTIQTFVSRVMSLLFSTLSRFVIAFLPRSNCFLNSWLQSSSTVLLEPKKRKSVTTSTFSPSICRAVMGWMPWSYFLKYLAWSLSSHFPPSPSSRGSLVPLSFLPFRVVSSVYLRLLMFVPPILILACNSSSLAFLMMCSAYTLNKHGGSR